MYVFKDLCGEYRKPPVGEEAKTQKTFDESGANYLYK